MERETNKIVALVQFSVRPEEIDEFLRNAFALVKDHVRHQPGFISANFHVRLDRHQVMNYTEWESEAQYDAFIKTIDSVEHGGEVSRYRPEISRYHVVRRFRPKRKLDP